jgi:hypothetical protein
MSTENTLAESGTKNKSRFIGPFQTQVNTRWILSTGRKKASCSTDLFRLIMIRRYIVSN